MAKEILIIEDEGFIAGLLSRSLSQKGYEIAVLQRKDAAGRLRRHKPSLVLLEAPPTEDDTNAACRSLRDRTAAPIIVLTDSTAELDELDGVEYLTKPLDFRTLLGAVEGALKHRRMRKARKLRELRRGDLSLDLQTHCLTKGDHRYHLTPKEFFLLKMFMTSPGRVLTHKAIMHEVWDTDYLGDTRTLYVHVSWLRRKIEDAPRSPTYLRTVRGVGYRFTVKT